MSPSAKPVRKVSAAAAAGASVTLAMWLLKQFGVELPPDVSSALVTVGGFIAGYLTSPE